MLKPLRYFFLRVYEFKLRSEPEGLAAFTAVCATSAAVACHLLALKILFDRLLAKSDHFPHSRREAQALGLVVMLAIMVVFYQAWVGSGRYRTFRDEFQAETHDQRQVRSVLVIVYAILSFLVPAVLMIWLPNSVRAGANVGS
jgi:hypothetical protein